MEDLDTRKEGGKREGRGGRGGVEEEGRGGEEREEEGGDHTIGEVSLYIGSEVVHSFHLVFPKMEKRKQNTILVHLHIMMKGWARSLSGEP